MTFRRRATQPLVAASPEALYPMLAHGKEAPRELWSRQADALRSYYELTGDSSHSISDVAIELPTGAGKTLVGCLIAEWRRRKHAERVAYVSPTRQLAAQAAEKSRLYGIPSVDLSGRHTGWNPGDETRFIQGEAVAFVTYSSIFNTNPHINAQALVLDDAHAAEGSVSSNWSVLIHHSDPAFAEVLEVLARAGALSPDIVRRLQPDDPDSAVDGLGEVYLAGIAEVAAASGELERVLEDAAADGGMSRKAQFALTMISGSLPACMVYVSRRELLIRPLIAPTKYHQAFTGAAQRVYMSATLGEGGELERAFGRRAIRRIPVPAGWETQGTGRRFFAFPDLLSGLPGEPQLARFVSRVIESYRKAVLIAPSDRARDRAVELMVPEGMPVWEPQEYAEDPAVFADAAEGVLALANRYDGIDLPDDVCRLVVLAGLPVGMHLQERFLHDSLAALSVLTERIRTRLTQGTGRATRNSSDYAAVILLGRELVTFCAQGDVQSASHPELRAELRFGLENSRGVPAGEALENLQHFLAQDSSWQEAEQDIIAERESLPRTSAPDSAQLAAAARHEVAAVDAAWQGDWEHAIDEAAHAAAQLTGGEAIRRYQALWHYIVASWAVIAARAGDQARWQGIAQAHFADARAAAGGTRWLFGLTTDAAQLLSGGQAMPASPIDEVAVSGIASSQLRTGRNRPFGELIESVRAGLAQASAGAFERAVAGLGELAGASVLRRTGNDAEPDAVWSFGGALWVAFEAKSECDPEGQVSAGEVRQAGAHLNYAASCLGGDPPEGSFAVLVSPCTAVHPAAAQVADARVYLVSPDVLADVAARITGAWESIRVQTRDLAPTEAADVITGVLSARRALPTQWLPLLTARRVRGE